MLQSSPSSTLKCILAKMNKTTISYDPIEYPESDRRAARTVLTRLLRVSSGTTSLRGR